QLSHSNTIKKNLDKLPLVKMFLQRYTESITEYQLRRLTTTCVDLLRGGEPLKKWVVLRQAGLSQERLTADAQTTLDELRLF
ncbi:TPA: transcriptional antiterminator, partial [Klebsiella pneumoniae]|nr:transcriptional antiterminator [Klebsiella pneumoniae]